jgi:hypothetical protein
MKDLFRAIGIGLVLATIGIGAALAILFALGLMFNQLPKSRFEKHCTIEFSDHSKTQAKNCVTYRDSTSLNCNEGNFSMCAIKSWACK